MGIPIAPLKVFGPLTCLEFLGITLDTVLLQARLSEKKIKDLITKLREFLGRRKVTKKELLSLIGSLSFACKVIVPGRSFLSRMISLSCTVRENHFKIYLSKQVKEDMNLWVSFLNNWNGRSFFLSKQVTSSADLDFATDASGSIGYGSFFDGAWFAAKWATHQRLWSMATKELFPIMVSTMLWGSRWRNLRILVLCDNEATVKLLNKGYTSCEPAATMLRKIVFQCMTHNFKLTAQHIPGVDNSVADALSRFKFEYFFKLRPSAEPNMTAVPDDMHSFGFK